MPEGQQRLKIPVQLPVCTGRKCTGGHQRNEQDSVKQLYALLIVGFLARSNRRESLIVYWRHPLSFKLRLTAQLLHRAQESLAYDCFIMIVKSNRESSPD